jgi:hypothetical protein
MAEGFMGVPRGPLSAYLGAEELNRQAGMGELQGAVQVQGMLAKMQAQQKAQAYEQAITQAKTPEERERVVLQFGGPEGAMRHLDRQATDRTNKEATLGRLHLQEQMNQFQHEDRMRRAANDTERLAETARRNREKADSDKTLNELRAELGRGNLEIRQNAEQQTRQRALDQNVQQLGTALERANLPTSHSVLSEVEKALETTPTLADYISGPKSAVPDLLAGKDVAVGRQAFQKLFNITLKDRSGAAVTIPEFERLKKEFATGVFKNGDQLKDGVRQARQIINDHYRAIASGYGEEALNTYNTNVTRFGGVPIDLNASGPKKIANDAEYAALPSGTVFIGPDGKQRKKP